jgi:hypothetical protein
MVLISGMPEPIAVGSISRVDPIESMEKKTPHRQRADKGTRNEMKLAPAAADDEDDDDGAKEESTGVIDSSRVSTWKCAWQDGFCMYVCMNVGRTRHIWPVMIVKMMKDEEDDGENEDAHETEDDTNENGNDANVHDNVSDNDANNVVIIGL